MGHSTGAGCVNCLQKFRAAWWLAERWTGGPRLGGENRRSCNKCHWVVRVKERRSDMAKLDPERKIAGGKELVLLPRLQVRQHFPTDPHNHVHTRTPQLCFPKEPSGPYSNGDKYTQACTAQVRATLKCSKCTFLVHFFWLCLVMSWRTATIRSCFYFICKQQCNELFCENIFNNSTILLTTLTSPAVIPAVLLTQEDKHFFGKMGKSIKYYMFSL